MKFAELKKSLDNLKPVYYICGSDAFLRHKAQQMIIDRAIKIKELNVTTFTDENTDIFAILTACRSIPMMDEKRVVILNDISVKKADEIKPLVEYCQKPLSSTILIIIDSQNNSNLHKLEKYAEVVDCSPLDMGTLTKLIVTQLKPYNCTINSDALSKLVEYCNFDYTRINNEIIKLGNMLEGNLITSQDVEDNVHREIEYDIYELTKALSIKDGNKAVAVVNQLLERKEAPQMLLMMIVSSFRRMFYAVISKENNLTVANKLGVKEYAIKIAKDLGAKFSPAKLIKIIDMGAELDYQIKFGQIEDKMALYFYISNIVSM